MSITNDDIKKIAKLAKLTISKKETVEFADDLSRILDYFEKLNEADTSNINPTTNVAGSVSVSRKDEIVDSVDKNILLKNAPEVESDHFLIPKIIE